MPEIRHRKLSNMKYTIKPTHIDYIKHGDTVEVEGVLKTVGRKDIRRDDFMGTSLFGDCYRSGRDPVKLAIIETCKAKQ
jgi:hypothetical protein